MIIIQNYSKFDTNHLSAYRQAQNFQILQKPLTVSVKLSSELNLKVASIQRAVISGKTSQHKRKKKCVKYLRYIKVHFSRLIGAIIPPI